MTVKSRKMYRSAGTLEDHLFSEMNLALGLFFSESLLHITKFSFADPIS